MAVPAREMVTQLLSRVTDGDHAAADELLPLLYDQLHRLAERQMAREPRGHTLQATALVHEAYLRLVGDGDAGWNSRGHFYGAAAQAMRRILVERARRYQRLRHGAGRRRVNLDQCAPSIADAGSVDLIALDQALTSLKAHDPRMHEIVMLRFFAGLSLEDTASAMGISARTVRRDWSFARLWLYERLAGAASEERDREDGSMGPGEDDPS